MNIYKIKSRLAFFLAFLFSSTIMFGQTQLPKSLISNGAVSSSNGNIRAQGSIGQSIIGTQSAANTTVNNGFWSVQSTCDPVVTSLDDSGPGTLREIIDCADPGDTITFSIFGTIELTSGEIAINKGLTIDPGNNPILIDAMNTSRIFNISTTEEVTIKNVIFQRGNAGTFGGGAIFSLDAPVNLINCVFSVNQATNNGAVLLSGNDGNLINCRFSLNQATTGQVGALLVSNGNFNIINNIFNENTSANGVGAVGMVDATVNVTNSTFYKNSSIFGSGLLFQGTNLTVNNSIFFANSADTGGDIVDNGTSTINANNVIIGDLDASSLTAGVNNVIEIDPLLSGPDAFDFSLQPFSPAQGNADPALLPVDAFDADMDGDNTDLIDFDINRNARGSTDGCNYDMGAVETAQGGLTVINNNDSGIGSLRSHIECTNSNPNITFISFAIPGAGPHTIALQDRLPGISADNTTIDGTSQDGFELGNPMVIIDGGGTVQFMMDASGNNVSVLGLGIRNSADGGRCFFAGNVENLTFSSNVIFTNAGQDQAFFESVSNSSFFNNQFGIDVDGTVTSLNRPVLFFSNSSNNRISFNTFGGPSPTLLLGLFNGSNFNDISQNNIGTNADRTLSFGGGVGLILGENSNNNLVFRNTIANNNVGIETSDGSTANNFSENDFFCNSQAGIQILPGTQNDNLAPPIIAISSPTIIAGTAFPNEIVELYQQDNSACPDAACQGLFVDFTTADADGNWSFSSHNLPDGTVVTALNSDGASTSAFAICSVVSCEVSADAQGGMIDCNNPTVQLEGFSNQNDVSFAWEGPDGFTSSEQSPTVSTPGIYSLTVTDAGDCTATATTSVTADTQKPALTASGGTIDCNTPRVTLMASSTTSGVSFLWTDPDGNTTSDQNPEVILAGTYTVTATAQNGCDSTLSVEVIEIQNSAPVAGFDFAINELTISLTDSTSGLPTAWFWDFGDGQTSTEQNPSVTYTTGGFKDITLIASNECGSDTTGGVIELMAPMDAVNFVFPPKTEGPIGDTLDIPVWVTNFSDVVSIQFSIHTEDANIARIIGVQDFNLPDLNTDDFNQIDDQTLSFVWFFANGATLPDSSSIFTVRVVLGDSASCTPIFIDDMPTFVEVGVIDQAQNTIVSAPFNLVAGEICILPEANIFGQVFLENQAPLKEVEVSCTGQTPVITGPDGLYEFLSLATGVPYTITPRRNTNPLEGVTAIDLALIQRHILGIQFLDSPYKILSADVNNSSTVSALDLVNIQRLILGLTNVFPDNLDSWRFAVANFDFPNPANPLAGPIPEEIVIDNLLMDVTDADFVGMKRGDVNGTARGRIVGEMEMVLKESVENGLYTIEFQSGKDQKLTAYQFGINFDPFDMQLLDLKTGDIPGLDLSKFGMDKIQDGIISTLWYDPSGQLEGHELKEGTTLFSLQFKLFEAEKNLSERVWINSNPIPAVAYNGAGQDLVIVSEYAQENELETITSQFIKLGQVQPNPFREEAQLHFYLPEAAEVQFIIRDALGRVLKQVNQNRQSGDHQISIQASELSHSAWYSIQMRSGQFMQSRRFVLQK